FPAQIRAAYCEKGVKRGLTLSRAADSQEGPPKGLYPFSNAFFKRATVSTSVSCTLREVEMRRVVQSMDHEKVRRHARKTRDRLKPSSVPGESVFWSRRIDARLCYPVGAAAASRQM